MNGLSTYWQNNGTKILGGIIAINSGIAGGSIVLPPPFSSHSAAIIQWAVFINMVLGAVVTVRGFGNTQAIATAVTQQHANAIATAAANGTVPTLAPAGKLTSTP